MGVYVFAEVGQVGTLVFPGVSLRVRETHARTVRFVARARAVVLSVSVEKPSACLGGIHACLSVLQRETRQSFETF